jgi:hypothetical protein
VYKQSQDLYKNFNSTATELEALFPWI